MFIHLYSTDLCLAKSAVAFCQATSDEEHVTFRADKQLIEPDELNSQTSVGEAVGGCEVPTCGNKSLIS